MENRDSFLQKIEKSKSINFAAKAVREFLIENNSYSDYFFIDNNLPVFDSKKIKIAFLSSYTPNLIETPLRVNLFKNKIKGDINFSGFSNIEQELFDDESTLNEFDPEFIIVSLSLEDLFPDFIYRFSHLNSKEIEKEFDGIIKRLVKIIELNSSKNRKTIICDFGYPTVLDNVLYHSNKSSGQIEQINELNKRIKLLRQKYADFSSFHFNYLQNKIGIESSFDSKLWYTSKIPFSKKFLIEFSNELSLHIANLLSSKKKCLVLDLDGTLWGGILGEDGINNILIGHDYPGNIYRDMQLLLKRFIYQGILLCACSKNNLEEVKQVFEQHPDMILGFNDFAASRINWKNKHENIRSIAEELNIGLNSFVFIDDSYFEINAINNLLPEVETIHLSGDELQKLETVKNIHWFYSIDLTEEDKIKTNLYRNDKKREESKTEFNSIEDYYRFLEMKLEIKSSDEYSINRISQLTQKTNQFNLTTRRYSISEIKKNHESTESLIFYLRLKDRFGDNGIIGTVIINITEESWKIDTLLLSCRILGRTVETALISHVINEARKQGAKSVIGEYIKSARNQQTESFYENHGFKQKGNCWYFDTENSIDNPEWIEILTKEN